MAGKPQLAPICTPVSTHDQQTLKLQNRAIRDYAARRGWTIAIEVKEVGSGASVRELRQRILDAGRRRDIDGVIVWRLDRWGRSTADLVTTLQELRDLQQICDGVAGRYRVRLFSVVVLPRSRRLGILT
jgi:hypothetical protein